MRQTMMVDNMQANEVNVMIFWVCVAIGVIVYAAIIWSLVAYRKSKTREASFHKSTATEIVWTVIPLLIIIAMTVPAAKLLTRLYNTDGSNAQGLLPDIDKQDKQALVSGDLLRQSSQNNTTEVI